MTTSAPPKAGRREWTGLAVLSLACLLYAMDLTVLHLAIPAISADLRPSSSQLLWIMDIYGFMVAGLLITMGTLGDRIGRRKLLLVGAAAFGVLSLLAAFSPSAETLMISRALLGIAGATIAPSTLSLIFNMFRDPRQRSVAIGIWIGGFSAGGALGPAIGGILLDSFWWGSVFIMGVPVMAALLILGPIVLPEFRDANAGRLDPISAAQSLVAIISVIYGLKHLAQDGPSWVAFGAIALGVGIAVVFVRRQFRLADPMIDLRLFKISSFRTSLFVNMLGIFVAVGYFVFVAQYLQLVLALSPLEAGLWSVPSGLAFIVGSQLGPRVVNRLRPAAVIGGGLGLSAVGLLMLTAVSAADGLAIVVTASVIIALGLAPVFGLTTEIIVGSAPPERAGAASGLSETGAELGGALGISILGSIGVAIYRADIADALPPGLSAPAADSARDTLGAALEVAADHSAALGGPLAAAARDAFLHGMHLTSFITAVAAVGLAVLAIVTLRHLSPLSSAESATHEAADDGLATDALGSGSELVTTTQVDPLVLLDAELVEDPDGDCVPVG